MFTYYNIMKTNKITREAKNYYASFDSQMN